MEMQRTYQLQIKTLQEQVSTLEMNYSNQIGKYQRMSEGYEAQVDTFEKVINRQRENIELLQRENDMNVGQQEHFTKDVQKL